MKLEKLVVSVFIVGMCIIIPLAAVLITIRLARGVVDSIFRKLGLIHQDQESMPVIYVYPNGDIPQPETPNIGNKLSVPR